MDSRQQEPIAIVGTGCRFPGGANSPSALWKLLESPYDVGEQLGPDRFDARTFYHPDGSHHGTSNVLRSYLLREDIRDFDAPFFNLSPNEADCMDPQQRLLLEVVYEALEAGGHAMEALRGSDTAVFVGTMTADYNDTLTRDHNTMPSYFATGVNRAIISNRVSYFYDWHGPSMTIDTACSSSLIAVHQGVRALRSGEARVALACGTQVLLNPEMYIGESNLKMLSPHGRSAMWSADADGYARGEGVAALVLKRLSDALADGDHVECVVRETGANQDGFSSGLTVPSTVAQAAMIRDTYARAGLDPEREPADRPQFFEAHGTGTQAGDPREAEAIHDCFGRFVAGPNSSGSGSASASEFGSGRESGSGSGLGSGSGSGSHQRQPLHVGSVKTVIGHLEGCAGLAGLIKGAAMIREAMIPPNLHFSRLNPKIEPFYEGLNVPTRLMPWPELAQGVPRRVSVNSFGFGGTNAHAILEQYQPETALVEHRNGPYSISLSPFVFSASSEASLVAQLQAYSRHLKTSEGETVNASDLAWTLSSRRSQLSTKVAFSALTIEQLASKIDAKLDEASRNAGTAVGLRSSVKPGAARLLGVFTGQGAQWPAMGAQLIRSSAFVSRRIQELEHSLASLPPSDRPAWSLREEMLAGDEASRIAEAALSQPLCTAVQVVMIDLLRAAGVTFAAVVGHSSGEIAAAYAAGFIDARDAIRIAYYRGRCARLAGNDATGQKGAMLAAGLSWEEAQDIVNSEAFRGRLAVAAHNSPASVTLSGDADAVAEAKKLLDGEKKFARALKVDTAYHSHHMLPCGEGYVEALRACGVRVNRERSASSCAWFSSVSGSAQAMEPVDALKDVYWRDNMTNAVLFSEAIINAVADTEQIDLVIEVGPHPALKGPATQNIAELRSSPLPYTGVLSRGKNDVEAFAESLGFVWTHVPHMVNFKAFQETLNSEESGKPRMVLGLPSYQWYHERSYWAESRVSRRMRTRKHAHHEILGVLSTESNSHDMRWSNVLKQKEISWLDGHQLQGQTVFPAAGYVAMALEASKVLVGDRPVELFELHKLTIPKAMTFEEGDNLGVETLVTLTGIQYQGDESATADFSCYCVPVLTVGSQHDMELTASGKVKIIFGSPDVKSLCSLPPDDYNMTAVDIDYFYESIASIGYNYSGSFATLSSAKRRLNKTSALVDSYCYSDDEMTQYLVHPSMLDVAFQAAILAYSSPGDERLWALSVPTSIETIRVNPEVCAALPTSGSKVPVLAIIDDRSDAFSTSIDLFSEHGEYGMIQVEDLTLKPFAPATKADDRTLFTYTKADNAVPDFLDAVKDLRPSAREAELAKSCEKISCHLLRKWKSELAGFSYASHEQRSQWRPLADWVDEALTRATQIDVEPAEFQELIGRDADSIDVKILLAIDRNLSQALREGEPVESLVTGEILDNWYETGLGFATYNLLLSMVLKQLVHRYPHARILEIGAGTGETTKSVLSTVGDVFSSYTFTDLSPDVVSKAAGTLKSLSKDKMKFAAMDIEAPPAEQGFNAHSYEIVIASNALTAVNSREDALKNIRSLVRPGGYLLLGDITNASTLRSHVVLGSALGLWHRTSADQKSSPTVVGPRQYHQALRQAGFGGIDAHTPDIDPLSWPLSVMVSQAVDDRVQFLRRPTSARLANTSVFIESLVILGNATLDTARIGDEVAEYLERFCGEVIILNGLPTEEDMVTLNPQSTFINLVDLDSPIFKDFTDEKMDGLQRMMETAKHILWITQGGRFHQPYHMASLSFGRSIRQESTHITFSHMDLSDLEHNVPKSIAEYLLQQYALDEWNAPPSTLADRKHWDFEFLWSRESEVFLDRGKLKILRHVPHIEQNARLNSSRRPITETVSVSQTDVCISPPTATSKNLSVSRVAPRRDAYIEKEAVSVLSSSAKALPVVDDTFLFVSISNDERGELKVLLSTANSSKVSPVAALPVPKPSIGLSHVDSNSLLVAVASELLSEALIRRLSSDSRVLIHCCGNDRFLAAALARRAAAKEISVAFICDEQDTQRDAAWTPLNSRLPNQSLRKMIQALKPTRFLDLTSSPDSLGRRVVQALPSNCAIFDLSTLAQQEASPISRLHDTSQLLAQLEDAVSRAGSVWPDAQDLVITLEQLRHSTGECVTSIVSWPQRHELVEIDVRPYDAQHLFAKDKTYLLVGLSGQIGQSLAEWMVENGAGCVCLTSRRPKVDQAWLDSFRGTGAIVKVLPLDVLDKASIRAAVADIRASCPPIAGVVNGAVIFDDQLFSNMSGAAMRKVLGPKIAGSNNLDETFYNDDLDFFVLLSSVVSVIGNAGQSNYAVANGYMDGLARQRRMRGLAASCLNLGRVAGIGYAEAAGHEVRDQLVKKLGLGAISEIDLRQLFAETIVAGFPRPEDLNSRPDASIDTGLRVFRDDEDLRGPWFVNPLFSHVVEESGNALDSSSGDKNAALPVAQRICLAATRDEALETMKEACMDQLRGLLQLGNQKIEPEAPLLELGIDSLLAVEIRSWFIKALKVDIPVLKIVSGASLSELCQKALEKMPDEVVARGSAQQEDNLPPKPSTPVSRPRPEGSVPDSISTPSLVSSSASSDKGSPRTAIDTTFTTATAPSSTGSVDDVQEKHSVTRFIKSERLSLPQSRFWFLRRLLSDPTTPNIVFKYHVSGNLRIGDLERAIRVVTARHEALRTCFVEEFEGGEASQKVLPASPMRLERKRISSVQDVASEYAQLKEHVFDLENGDVMRIVLLALSSTSHYLLVNYHHIVMDGASFNIFLADLDKAYRGQSLGPLPRQYPEFSAAQRAALERGEMSEELSYWKKVFPVHDPPPVLPLLPMARTSSRLAMNSFDTHHVQQLLTADLAARVKDVSRSMLATPFHLHLAAFKAMLFSLAGDDTKDLTIGIADAARNETGIEDSIGFFLNLLTLRFTRDQEQSFADSIVQARDTARSALGSSRLPFDVLLTELNIARSSRHSPFFQAFIDYRQGVKEHQAWGNCQFEFQDVHPGRTAYDITLDVAETTKAEVMIMFRVQTSLYDATAARLILKTYIHFLDVLTRDASLSLKDTPRFSEAQLAESTQIGRGPNLASDWPETLPRRIDQIAEQNQDHIALMDGNGKILTYSDMINRIEAISESLQNTGVNEGSRVLVCQEPAADWPCSMLAIMRLGAVYVPLDLRNPVDRLAAVAKDCSPSAILADATTMDTAAHLQAEEARIIDVSTLPLKAVAHIDNRSRGDMPAAILYTSGSTGTPKGIIVTHGGLRNEIEGYTKTWGLGAERVLQQSAFTFNHSSDQMYTGLVNGGMVYVVPADKRGDPLEITEILREHAITYTKATPSEYSLWIQFGGETLRKASSWRFAFGGGETLTGVVTREFASLELPHLRFFNSYGPTEISISSHKIEMPYKEQETVESMGRIPCGYSLPNYYTYVVDKQLRPVPVGMPGEICIGGAGVSRGYLNNRELTDKCFVANPFATPDDVSRGWTGMYRTGDIGHLREDGAMVFHSRMAGDSQVKIRGLRIELSDIESNIVSAAGGVLREAVVTLREGNPPFLVAHVVFSPQHAVADKEAFLQSLLGRLPIPQYMVPVAAIPLDKFPLNNHSKVDRRAVQEMPLPVRSASTETASELTETMVQLKRIWRDVLGKNVDKFGFDLGPKTNFFLVGGNSLLVIRLQAQIRQVFHVVVPLVKLLGASTLEEMASKVEESESVTVIDWEKETRPPSIPNFLHSISSSIERSSPSNSKTVLVTGATGYLARYVLPLLAARPDVDMIHCVAVRDKPRETTPLASPKIAYHVGDLTLPLLGLGVDEFRGLASQVDLVLHMGAVRSFWDNYHLLHPTNVSPVRELVKLAAARRVPIHYISTIGVLPRGDDGSTVPAASAAPHVPPEDGSDGYVSAKWASERILERAAETLGVPCSIYRFTPASHAPDQRGSDNTTANTNTNKHEREREHEDRAREKHALLDAFVRFVDSSRCVPDTSIWKGRIDMLHAPPTAHWLTASLLRDDQPSPAPSSPALHRPSIQFVHYQSPIAVHTDDVLAHIESQRGSRDGLLRVPVIQWFGKAKRAGFEYMIAAQEAVVGGGGAGEVLESRR